MNKAKCASCQAEVVLAESGLNYCPNCGASWKAQAQGGQSLDSEALDGLSDRIASKVYDKVLGALKQQSKKSPKSRPVEAEPAESEEF